MAVEMGLWRVDGEKIQRIDPSALELESHLEDYIESDPAMLGRELLIIGRQVVTAYGGFIDLLALDQAGTVHVVELKRDRTPRDVAAQTLDYGSWVASLGRQELVEIFAHYRPGVALEEAYTQQFGAVLPEEINTAQVFTIVASRVDSATERIVRFLHDDYAVPINVVFFRYFIDAGARYLARTWLVDFDAEAGPASTLAARKTKSREPWNGSDWYVSFGEYADGRQWADARRYGFVSGGSDAWFSRTLQNLPVDARVFVYIPGRGYVGVGIVTGKPARFDATMVSIDGVECLLQDLALSGSYRHEGDTDDAVAEWAVPIDWIRTVPVEQAVWKSGMYANQNTATKLRNQYTITEVSAAFQLDQMDQSR